jgi:hypothetical protein
VIQRALLSLALGGVTTVAVAWYCSARSRQPFPPPIKASRPWPCPVPTDWPATASEFRATQGFGLDSEAAWIRTSGSKDFSHLARVHHAGWPFRALSTHQTLAPSRWWVVETVNSRDTEGWVGAFAVPGWVPRPPAGPARVFPILPLWGGLVADIVLFASAWLLLSMLPTLAVRRRRRRRGCCGHCGHPLPGSLLCPECGRSGTA